MSACANMHRLHPTYLVKSVRLPAMAHVNGHSELLAPAGPVLQLSPARRRVARTSLLPAPEGSSVTPYNRRELSRGHRSHPVDGQEGLTPSRRVPRPGKASCGARATVTQHKRLAELALAHRLLPGGNMRNVAGCATHAVAAVHAHVQE